MDFTKACKQAEAMGISSQQFLNIWNTEAKMKQTENELRLQQLQEEAGKRQSSGDALSVTNLIEAEFKKFSAEQRQVLTSLKDELQQQNQALISDISRLLEGFASMVGRVVKGELETVVAGLNLTTSGASGSSKPAQNCQAPGSSAGDDQSSTRTRSKLHQEGPCSHSSKPAKISPAEQQSVVNDQGSTRTWSKVHQHGPASQELSGSSKSAKKSPAVQQSVVNDQGSTRTWSKVHQHGPTSQELSGSSKSAKKSPAPKRSVANEHASSRTWSNVHQEGPASQELSSDEEQITVEGLIRKATENAAKKKQKQQQPGSGTASIKSQPTKKDNGKQKTSNGGATPKMPKSSPVNNGFDNSASVHFYPEEGPATMLICDIPKIAESGKVCRSPVYYLQDCPCKVQLFLWFDTQKKMCMKATLWGLSLSVQQLTTAKVFTLSGKIKNKNSQGYSSLFDSESSPFKLTHSSSLTVKLDLNLKTGTGVFKDINLGELQKRNYILTEENAVSINWTITSSEVKA